MQRLIAIDWGTSNFRATLFNEDFAKIDFIEADKGVLSFQGKGFYPFIQNTLSPWLSNKYQITILMSGMIGSSIGWMETPYVSCEASLEDIANNLLQILNIQEDIYIMSGVKKENHTLVDVMRGEEVQVFGALEQLGDTNGLFVLPGTHSKWVQIKNKKIIDFQTNMTGEIFHAVSHHTILQKSIHKTKINQDAFLKGLELSTLDTGLLSQLFQVRSQTQVIGEDNTHSFLSAILIGNEIKQMKQVFSGKSIVLVGNSSLNDLYTKACNFYDLAVVSVDGHQAFCLAMISIYKTKLNIY